MNRYDFIRFGGLVQWFDDSTDTCRKMQVCLPPKEPIDDNTKIGLIQTNEDECEETPTSHSVKASELFPWLEPYQEGYWRGVQEAEKSGADMNVLLAMLTSSQFCLMECTYLMLQSNACKLFPALCQLFPEMEDMFQVITWEKQEYFARKLTIFRGTNDEQKILVSMTSLQDRLIDSDIGAPISDEAEEIDGDIYYYLTDNEMILPDETVIAMVESA